MTKTQKPPTLTERIKALEESQPQTWPNTAETPEKMVDMAELDPYWEEKNAAERELDKNRRDSCQKVLEAINDELKRPERVRSTNRVANLASAYKNLAYPSY